MSKRGFNRLDVDSGQAAWEATVNTDFELLEDLIETYPWPVFEVDKAGSLPAANLNDRAIAFHQESDDSWGIYFSDGSTWQRLTFADDSIPVLADITKGAESSNNIYFTIQVQNPRAENIARKMLVDVWIGTSDFGVPAGAQTTSVTTGLQIDNPIANQRLKVLTDATGKAVVRVNVVGAGTRYVMATIGASSKSLDGTWAA